MHGMCTRSRVSKGTMRLPDTHPPPSTTLGGPGDSQEATKADNQHDPLYRWKDPTPGDRPGTVVRTEIVLSDSDDRHRTVFRVNREDTGFHWTDDMSRHEVKQFQEAWSRWMAERQTSLLAYQYVVGRLIEGHQVPIHRSSVSKIYQVGKVTSHLQWDKKERTMVLDIFVPKDSDPSVCTDTPGTSVP